MQKTLTGMLCIFGILEHNCLIFCFSLFTCSSDCERQDLVFKEFECTNRDLFSGSFQCNLISW